MNPLRGASTPHHTGFNTLFNIDEGAFCIMSHTLIPGNHIYEVVQNPHTDPITHYLTSKLSALRFVRFIIGDKTPKLEDMHSYYSETLICRSHATFQVRETESR